LRSAMTKFLLFVFALTLALHGFVFAQTRSNWVVAVDLTQSETVSGSDGKSEFQRNLEAITNLLAHVPADLRLTVIGIADHSFTQPYILLSATIPADTGYFAERLTTAGREIVRTWKIRSSKLSPKFR